MMNKKFKGPAIAGFILIGIAFAALAIWVVMLLWNNILTVAVHGVNSISYWQAAGIFLLSKLLFGGFRKGCGGRGHWKNKMKAKWEAMSEEEREKFKQEWKNRCWMKPKATTEP